MNDVAQPVLGVTDLSVEITTRDGVVSAVTGLSFSVGEGEVLGVVGESGCGKSVTFLSILGLVNSTRVRVGGSARFRDVDLLTLPSKTLRKVRGQDISMVFQDPFSALHPQFTVGHQIVEAIRAHEDVTKRQAAATAVEALGSVGIPHPTERFHDYPHEFSGGMRQRAVIAMAIVNRPRLLIADEPTTALDVTTQAQIVELIDRLRRELAISVVFITHDLGVIGEIADRVMVMYAGRAVELGSKPDLFVEPLHPYTWGLFDSIPDPNERRGQLRAISGSPPSLLRIPTGCAFHPRCSKRFAPCSEERPVLVAEGDAHMVACHLPAAEKRRARR